MVLVYNYKNILRASFNPITPLFRGSWKSEVGGTKWRGVAAELTYNPYLRNGWVVVDTGVKGSSGSPLIEFSTWDSEDSKYNIILPNLFSYKFFFAKNKLRVGFLTRAAVEANEPWGLAALAGSITNRWNAWPVNRSRKFFQSRPRLTSFFF